MRAWRRWSRDVDVRVTSRSIVALLSFVAMTAGCGDKEPLAPSPPAPFAVSTISPAAGLAGQTVNITGSGFLPGAILKFGETPASSNVVASTRISATVPASRGHRRHRRHQSGRPAGNARCGIQHRNSPQRQPNGLARRDPRIVEPGGDLSVDWAVSANNSSSDWIGFLGSLSRYRLSGWVLAIRPERPVRHPDVQGAASVWRYQFRYLLDDGFIDVARAPVTVR